MSVYHPGDEQLDVGGGFYDVFEVGNGRWGIVLGDVMGKGADAAAMTALARHTVRAARLVATLATTAGSHAARTVETVVSTVTSFATGTADDLAALAMRID